jgi:hypothetical protein
MVYTAIMFTSIFMKICWIFQQLNGETQTHASYCTSEAYFRSFLVRELIPARWTNMLTVELKFNEILNTERYSMKCKGMPVTVLEEVACCESTFGQPSVSRNFRRRSPGTHWIRRFVSSIVGLNSLHKGQISCPFGESLRCKLQAHILVEF